MVDLGDDPAAISQTATKRFDNTELRRQKLMLLGTLVLVRKSLRDLDRIVPARRRSARATSPTAPSPSTTQSSARC